MPVRRGDAAKTVHPQRHWRPRVPTPACESSARVREFQRARILKAATAVAAEHGYRAMSATAVVARARVSPKTFYDLFGSSEGCFLAVVEQALGEMNALAAPAYEAPGSWPARLRGSLAALLAFTESEDHAGLALSYLLGYGSRCLEPRTRVLQTLQAGSSMKDACWLRGATHSRR